MEELRLNNMSILNKVFECKSRECAGFGFTAAKNGYYYKFPYIIGAQSKAILLFVGINPRLDESDKKDSNRELYRWIMADKEKFFKFASNNYKGKDYLATESHYTNYHLKVVNAIYPSADFKDVAAVTELFLCGKKKSSGLPIQKSPCAEKYLINHTIAQTDPDIIVAVGSMVFQYFWKRRNKNYLYEIQNHICEVNLDGKNRPVVKMLHPNSRSPHRYPYIKWTAEILKILLENNKIPDKLIREAEENNKTLKAKKKSDKKPINNVKRSKSSSNKRDYSKYRFNNGTYTKRGVVLAVLKEDRKSKPDRSEERRVGKECRSRWSPYH